MAILAPVLALTASCQSKHGPILPPSAETAETPGSPGVSLIQMNDPKAGAQLVRGFYGIESNSWRWTAGKFAARFHVPPTGASAGATVTLNFVLPESAIQQLGHLTLTAAVNGTELQSSTYDHAGTFSFTGEIPPTLLNAESVTVDFSLDKTFHAGGDTRELGVVANSVGLAGK